MEESVQVYLKSGNIITCYYDADEYDGIYESILNKELLITFTNCAIVTSEIEAIEWGVKE